MNRERQENGRTQRSNQDFNEQLATGLGWFSVGLGLAELLAPGKLAQFIGVPETDRSRSVMRFYGMRELAAGIGILTQERPTKWMWGRVGGDMVDLATLGSAMTGGNADTGKVTAATLAVLGVTALDLYCAQQLSNAEESTGSGRTQRRHRGLEDHHQHAIASIFVNKTPDEAYRYWRDYSNLARFMDHIDSVEETGNHRSHWKAKGPAGMTIEWDAETTIDEPDQRICWRSLEGADVDNSGRVEFEKAPGNRGTIVRVHIHYAPPAGKIGATLLKLFGQDPSGQIKEDLRAFKQLLEVGERVNSDASIHTGMHPSVPAMA